MAQRIRQTRRPTQAVILVGGMGSRLGELTSHTPKPLLNVSGKPFLEHLIFEIGRHRIKQIILAAQYKSENIVEFANQSVAAKQLGLNIKVSIEPERAGTGGALLHARNLLDEEFYVFNGDSWLDVNLLAMSFDATPSDALAVMAVRHLADATRFGVVETSRNKITSFHERPKANGPGVVNAGFYLCKREILNYAEQHSSLEQSILPTVAKAGRLYAYSMLGFFVDIGVPESLATAQVEIQSRIKRPAAFLDRDGVLNLDTGHVGKVGQFKWISGAIAAVRQLNDRGYLVFVVTNQAGVAKGYYGEDDVVHLHAHMDREMRNQGAHVDDYRYCPFHPEGTVDAYRSISDWRKPNAGMIRNIMENWPISFSSSFLIGDKDSDIQAAKSIGLTSHLFQGGDLSEFLAKVLP